MLGIGELEAEDQRQSAFLGERLDTKEAVQNEKILKESSMAHLK